MNEEFVIALHVENTLFKIIYSCISNSLLQSKELVVPFPYNSINNPPHKLSAVFPVLISN